MLTNFTGRSVKFSLDSSVIAPRFWVGFRLLEIHVLGVIADSAAPQFSHVSLGCVRRCAKLLLNEWVP